MLDSDGNGVSDVWEQKFNAAALVASQALKDADFDNDGKSNFEESLAGTDPRDSKSCHAITGINSVGTNITIECPTEKGKMYQIFTRVNLGDTETWTSHGTPALASGSSMQTTLNNQAADLHFYRVKVTDTDSDNDGLSDWEEEQIPEVSPTDANTLNPSVNDYDIINGNFQNLQSLAIAVDNPNACEKEAVPATYTISRNGTPNTYPFTIYFHTSGATDPTKSSASTDDYIFKDAADAEITADYVTIPAGVDSIDIIAHPVVDAKAEVPETLVLNISTTTKFATTRICDAANTDENRKLFLAQLTPVTGTGSTASGLGSMLLNGDNDIGYISINFFGLGSTQQGAHLQYSNFNTQTNLATLLSGQVGNSQYPLRATQFLTTDQDILDALLSGFLAVNIESKDHINGEIRGNLVPSEGYTEEDFVAPAAPPATPMLAGEDLDRDIVRFLTQATFGPTPASIQEVKNLVTANGGDQLAAYGAYIDMHLIGTTIPSPSMELLTHGLDAHEVFHYKIPSSPDYKADGEPRERNRRRAWWTLAVYAPDQIRQKTAYALSQILVISEGENVIGDRHYAMANYYDMLKSGIDGTYRDLIEDVSKHPCMGQYLSALRNQKEDGVISPDENYAREIMQLFSIGLAQLHEDGSFKLSNTGTPIPSYSQIDISALSRVFTGWSFAVYNNPSDSNTVVPNTTFNRASGNRYYQDRFIEPMIQFPSYHDTAEKVMPTLELTIPAGKTGEEELTLALDKLVSHDNTAPFVVRRLIQRFVTSNPSNGYIYRMTQVWKNTNGNIAQVVKAILLDYEARAIAPTLTSSFGKKREPLLQHVSIIRALDVNTKLPVHHLDDSDETATNKKLTPHAYNPVKYAEFNTEFQAISASYPTWANASIIRHSDVRTHLSQMAMASPSVFNFYLPDYAPSGTLSSNGLLAPEFQIATEVSVVRNLNYYYAMTNNTSGQGVSELPNQGEVIAHNPYNYAKNDDHLLPNKDPLTNPYMNAYLSVMDTNSDNKINELDTTFDQDQHLYAAVVAMVDKLDLNLTGGQLKSQYAAGFDYQNIRIDNPRDQIIESTRRLYDYYDDDGDVDPNDGSDNVARDEARQTTVQRERYEWAAYLISACPTGAIQK